MWLLDHQEFLKYCNTYVLMRQVPQANQNQISLASNKLADVVVIIVATRGIEEVTRASQVVLVFTNTNNCINCHNNDLCIKDCYFCVDVLHTLKNFEYIILLLMIKI